MEKLKNHPGYGRGYSNRFSPKKQQELFLDRDPPRGKVTLNLPARSGGTKIPHHTTLGLAKKGMEIKKPKVFCVPEFGRIKTSI